jgi:hypothetical protein
MRKLVFGFALVFAACSGDLLVRPSDNAMFTVRNMSAGVPAMAVYSARCETLEGPDEPFDTYHGTVVKGGALRFSTEVTACRALWIEYENVSWVFRFRVQAGRNHIVEFRE